MVRIKIQRTGVLHLQLPEELFVALQIANVNNFSLIPLVQSPTPVISGRPPQA